MPASRRFMLGPSDAPTAHPEPLTGKGVRHVDTAAEYNTEAAVAEGQAPGIV